MRRSSIDEKSADLAVFQGKNEELDTQLSSLQNENKSKSNELDQLQRESSQLLIEEVHAELTKSLSQRDCLRKELGTVEEELMENRVTIDNYMLIISQLNNDIQSKDDTLVEKVQYISNLLTK